MDRIKRINDESFMLDEYIWRYFKVDRFISTIENNSLYFSSANQFMDKFEGAVAVQTELPSTDPGFPLMEEGENSFAQLKRLTKINCWHRAEYESDAMWRLYAGEGKGIAIRSTPARIIAAIEGFRLHTEYGLENFYIGPIKYIDLTCTRMAGDGMLERFFIKHRAFEWERELRIATSLRMAEEFGVSVPQNGIIVKVDLAKLIDEIVLGPMVLPNERKVVMQCLDHAGLNDRLRPSSLLGWPRYL